jgi:hypothetical protein
VEVMCAGAGGPGVAPVKLRSLPSHIVDELWVALAENLQMAARIDRMSWHFRTCPRFLRNIGFSSEQVPDNRPAYRVLIVPGRIKLPDNFVH